MTEPGPPSTDKTTTGDAAPLKPSTVDPVSEDAFRLLGVQLQELEKENRSLREQMMELADKIKELEAPPSKPIFKPGLFGRKRRDSESK